MVQGLFQQYAAEAERLNAACGGAAATQKRLSGLLPRFGRLLRIAGDAQVPAVPTQCPLQHVQAGMEAVEGRLLCRAIAVFYVHDVIDAKPMFGGLAGRGQHDAEP